jgi:hypothetical protein
MAFRTFALRIGTSSSPSSGVTDVIKYTPPIQCLYPDTRRRSGSSVLSCWDNWASKSLWLPMTQPSEMSAAISAPVKLAMSSCRVGGGMLNGDAQTLHRWCRKSSW